MATFYRPTIQSTDYPAFAAIVDLNLPKLASAWKAQHDLSERQLRRSGHRTVSIPVKPGEFLSYCRERHLRPDRVALHAFAQYSGPPSLPARSTEARRLPVITPVGRLRPGGPPLTR